MIATYLAEAGHYLRFEDLHLSPVLLEINHTPILKWYSLAYIAGVLVGWWYLLRLLRAPGAPMSKKHADDLVFFATLGIILGGRLGYAIFYEPGLLTSWKIVALWEGGMSLHGGVIGTTVAILYFARRNGLSWLRIHDYVACCAPFGLMFGRLANFVNGELWGKQTDVAWAIIFPNAGDVPRHPSQLYEAGLEGVVLFAILWLLFWKTRARFQPGRLVGAFLLFYGLFRFFLEFFREPDAQFAGSFLATTIHMGQLLCLPMILGGIWLIATSAKREATIVPIPADPAPPLAQEAEAPEEPPAEDDPSAPDEPAPEGAA